MKRENYYVPDNAPIGGFNRRAERRKDAAWVRERLTDPATRLYPVWRGASLAIVADEPRAPLLTAQASAPIAIAEAHPQADIIFLGEADEVAHFALEISHVDTPSEIADLAGHMLGDGGTGDPLDDMCLMGQSHRFAKRLYSTLAGFVEPGENLEQAATRELHEEAGIAAANVRYASSQPWPFPSSLMLGFYADAVTAEIDFDREELADCRWFTHRYPKAQRKADGVTIPPRHSIARRLTEDWLFERWDD